MMPIYSRLKFLYRAHRFRWLLDRAEIQFISKFLSEGDSAIDIGAHKGAYTYWMRKAVGISGRVYSFEPQPELARYLYDITQILQMNNVIIENKALSAQSGKAVLEVPGDAVSPGATIEKGLIKVRSISYEVPVTTLDEYFEEKDCSHIKLIKCDVEGHELSVFKGGENILKDQKPLLIFECEQLYHPSDSIQIVFDYLHDLNYFGYYFLGRQFHELKNFDPSIHQADRNSEYVNNFLFSADKLI